MKRALVAAILGMTACVTSYGQGVIQFNNYQSTTFQQVKYANNAALLALSGQAVVSPTVQLQLFWAVGTFVDTATFLGAATAGVTTFINPTFSYQGGGYYNGPNQTLAGWNAISAPNVTFMVRAWESTGGLTYANANIKGQSTLWTEGPGADANSKGIQPAANPAQYFNVGPPAMTIDLVPEPTSLALVGLGLGSMLFARRRQA